MKILLISSVALKTPPTNYGGLEAVVYNYTCGLADLGHDVTLAASKGSTVPSGVHLIETVESWNTLTPEAQRAYAKKDRLWNGWRAQEEEAYGIYRDTVGEVDVVGDHSWSKWSFMSQKEEIVGTCHSIKPYNVKPPRAYGLMTGVSSGHSHTLSREWHTPVRTLLNPVDVERYPFQRDKGERVLSFNRIMPTKGIHLFVQMCEKDSALKADVAGDDSTLVPDRNYVNFIKDKCLKLPNTQYYGLVEDDVRLKLMQNARCLVCLKDGGYEEVFGLNVVESLACGTPVVALKSWGFSDIIENGKSGFVCDNMDEVVKAVKKVGEINPEECRKRAMQFSRKNRSLAYEQMLLRVKQGCRW